MCYLSIIGERRRTREINRYGASGIIFVSSLLLFGGFEMEASKKITPSGEDRDCLAAKSDK